MNCSYATITYRNKRLVLTVLLLFLFVWTGFQLISKSELALSRLLLSPKNVLHQQHQQQQQVSLPKVLFWTLTVDSESNKQKVAAVADTWGRRVDKLLLISNGTELGLRTDQFTLNAITGLDSRKLLWRKVIEALRYLHANHLNDYDWFMKTDDDTYVLVDNLKSFLATKSSEEPVYFGHKFNKFIKQGYMSGGSGYVLSRRALDLIVVEGFEKNNTPCLMDTRPEDVAIGACLEAVGVEAGSTTDSLGRPTFLPLSPAALLTALDASQLNWYPSYTSLNPVGFGKNCCSSEPISFHYIEPKMMRFIDWLLYVIKPGLSLH